MKDEDRGQMYAELVIFIIGCIPVILCAVCFSLAGWTYVAVGETDFMHRLLTVGWILGCISFMFAIAGGMTLKSLPVEEDDESNI